MASLFDRLVDARPGDWHAYTHHAFVERLADGTLPAAAFRHYLVQDYLFLIQFARAYALAVYKARTLQDMAAGMKGLKAILDLEMDLHVRTCAGWGLSRADMEATPEDLPTVAYTRFVLDVGHAGDLLDLHVALSPCVIGYAHIARGLKAIPGASEPTNPYGFWIDEYAGEAYAPVADEAVATLERLAGIDLPAARFERLAALFGQACRLEAAFWQMGLDAAR